MDFICSKNIKTQEMNKITIEFSSVINCVQGLESLQFSLKEEKMLQFTNY